MKTTVVIEVIPARVKVKIAPDLLILPRIGDTVDITNILDTDEDRRVLHELYKKVGTPFVVDVYHEFFPGEHHIGILLDTDADQVNDFYKQLRKPDAH